MAVLMCLMATGMILIGGEADSSMIMSAMQYPLGIGSWVLMHHLEKRWQLFSTFPRQAKKK